MDQIESATPSLSQNSPNPFNHQTVIGYYLPRSSSKAMINIYNMSGNLVKSINISKTGHENILIDGSELHPGMYLYSLIYDDAAVDIKWMVLTE